jgi:hypothetical protein
VRRNWRALALAAFLLALVILALTSARALRRLDAPTAELVAAALSRILERPVEIRDADLSFGLNLAIELYDLRVMEPDSDDQPPTLEVAYARGEQSWPRVLVGQIVPLNWDVAGPILRIPELDGKGTPPTAPDLPAVNLDLRDGRVEWHRGDGELMVVDELVLSARRSPFGLAMHGQARGRVSRGELGLSRFDLRIDGRPSNFSLKGGITELDLSALPLGEIEARGLGKGEIAIGVRGEAIEGRASLRFAGLELPLPGLSSPIIPENNRLNVDLSYSPGALSLAFNRLELDDFVVMGRTVYRGGADAYVSANLDFESFEPAASPTRLQPLRALGLRYATWELIGARVGAGRIEGLSIQVNAPVDRLADIFAFRGRIGPEELTIELSAAEGVYYPSLEGTPLEQISGDVAIRGNTLEVRELRMQREGRDLPQIDLSIDGMHRLVRLPPEERNAPKGPGTPIPGLEAAAAALRAPSAPERTETSIHFADLELHYPAFVFPFRQGRGLLRFPEGSLVVEEARGILGGAPAELSAVWDPGTSRVGVRVKYLDDEVEPRATRPRDWLSGQIDSDELYFGDWRVADLSAQLNARGADVRVHEVRGRLLEGDVSGSGALSLAEQERAAFEFNLDVTNGDASRLEPHIGLPAGSLTGKLDGTGRLAGALTPDRDFLRTADIELSLNMKQGIVGNLPPALVLARLPSLRGVSALLGRSLPYDTVDTIIAINRGTLQVADFKLVGPELRILASGEIDLATDDYQTDLVVAVLFLQTVDKLLGALPIVRDIVLGPDKNLLAAYFQLTGPWSEPDANILAPRAIQTAFGLLTGAIKGTVKQLIKLIPRPGSGDASGGDPSGKEDGESSGQD